MATCAWMAMLAILDHVRVHAPHVAQGFPFFFSSRQSILLFVTKNHLKHCTPIHRKLAVIAMSSFIL